jgi:hypothetical protein
MVCKLFHDLVTLFVVVDHRRKDDLQGLSGGWVRWLQSSQHPWDPDKLTAARVRL